MTWSPDGPRLAPGEYAAALAAALATPGVTTVDVAVALDDTDILVEAAGRVVAWGGLGLGPEVDWPGVRCPGPVDPAGARADPGGMPDTNVTVGAADAAVASDLVVDADGHVCEPADLWERNLPSHLADARHPAAVERGDRYDECLVEDRMATDRGLVGLGNAGEPYDDFGRGRHYEDLNPAGFDPHERVKVLDSEGIDVTRHVPRARA